MAFSLLTYITCELSARDKGRSKGLSALRVSVGSDLGPSAHALKEEHHGGWESGGQAIHFLADRKQRERSKNMSSNDLLPPRRPAPSNHYLPIASPDFTKGQTFLQDLIASGNAHNHPQGCV